MEAVFNIFYFVLSFIGFFMSEKVKSTVASSGNKTSKASRDRGWKSFYLLLWEMASLIALLTCS